MCCVCHSLFTLSLGVMDRLCSVIVTLPGLCIYYFSNEYHYICFRGDIRTRAVVGQRSSPAGYILYCNIFIIKPYNIGHTDLDVFVCKSFCHIDIIIQV